MSVILFSCPACGAQLRLAETLAGKTIRCPKCRATAAVPVPVQEVILVEEEIPTLPMPDDEIAAPVQQPHAAAPRKKKSRSPWLISLAIALPAVVLFAVLIWALLGKTQPDLPIRDLAEETRLAKQRVEAFQASRKQELQFLAQLRKGMGKPPTAKQPLVVIMGGEDFIQSLAFSPDGQKLACGRERQQVEVWDLATRKLLWSQPAHAGLVWYVGFTPDGQRLVSASADELCKVFDAHTGALRQTLPGSATRLGGLAFAPDGKAMACGRNSGPFASQVTITLWDLDNSRETGTLVEKGTSLHGLTFAPDGRTLATCTRNGITFWDVSSKSQVGSVALNDPLSRVKFSLNGKYFAGVTDATWARTEKGVLRLWELQTRTVRMQSKADEFVLGGAFTLDSRFLVAPVCRHDQWPVHFGDLKIWDAETATLKKHLQPSDGWSTFGDILAFSPGGTLLASSGGGSTIEVWVVDDLVR